MKFNTYRPHLINILIGVAVIFIFFYPVLSGKGMLQSDMIQFKGTFQEAKEYNESTGEEILWSGTSFSGMPVWRGFGNDLLSFIYKPLEKIMPSPVYLSFYAFIGFYILLLAFGVSPVLSLAGGLAFTLSSFNIISIEAGHMNKVADMALMAPVLAGLVYLYRGRYFKGLLITTFFSGMHILYSHYQITYYLLFVILFYAIAEFYTSYKSKNLKKFFIASSLAIMAGIIGLLPNVSRLWTNYEYGKLTTRGGSELKDEKKKDSGLNKDYVFAWSNGVKETFTILIPGFYGGSSHESLSEKSETYKRLLANGVNKYQANEYIKSMPMYWGDQPFTSGPVYFGAIVCFLFVFGLIAVKGPHKWWIASVSAFAIMLSWGNNFELLSDLFYDYVPLYNKFRSVTMIMSIAQLSFPLLGFIALSDFIRGKISQKDAVLGFKVAFIVTGGFSLLFFLLGGALFDFSASSDSGNLPDWLIGALREDRASMLRMDSFRSLFFIVSATALIFFFYKKKLQGQLFYPALILLIVTDLWFVNKRYLNSDDFHDLDRKMEEVFRKSEADKAILAKNEDGRVLNLTRNPFSDGMTSYHHKSIGGYSAIKLARYQDLIDHHLGKNNMAVLNMLNTRYVIVSDKQTNAQRLQINPDALGNAWFVKNYKMVENADEEIIALNDFNPAETAIIDKRFEDQVSGLEAYDKVEGAIKLENYHPNRLDYKVNVPREQLAVFSEIYFRPGWNAYLDGEPVEHMRVNYILRGMVIPQGEHTIQFKFEPYYYFTGEKIALGGSILFYLAIAACAFGIYREKRNNTPGEEEKRDSKLNSLV
ncbi:MAG: YfhO family protein [Cytophagaceae bacterium]